MRAGRKFVAKDVPISRGRPRPLFAADYTSSPRKSPGPRRSIAPVEIANERAGRPAAVGTDAGGRGWVRRIGYRIGGLPIALRAKWSTGATPELVLRRAYADQYFRIARSVDLAEIGLAVLLAPLVVPVLIVIFTSRNGRTIARSSRRPIWRQVIDQVRLYVAAGVLAPWYYILELHREPTIRHARRFAYRWETKGGVFKLLTNGPRAPTSPLLNKAEFEAFCRERALPTPVVLAIVSPHGIELRAPETELRSDLFVKPVNGRGGKGAQRWDFRAGQYFSVEGEAVAWEELIERMQRGARLSSLIVQRRITNHQDLRELANGALSTVRILTCLDERGPQPIAAIARMAIGQNRTVDNLHCGGIAAAVDLQSGQLGRASNLGLDPTLGWITRHPDTHAQITGTILPMWEAALSLALRAHRSFADRALVGWDIALTADGPVIVEGNGAPDLDIVQRFYRRGLMDGSFAKSLYVQLERTFQPNSRAA